MDSVMHNATIKILSGPYEGIYRVILVEKRFNQVALVRLDPPESAQHRKGGRKPLAQTKRPRKKKAPPLVGSLEWIPYADLELLVENNSLNVVDIETDINHLEMQVEGQADKDFERRKTAMAIFLDYDNLRDSIISNAGLGGLVKEAMNRAGFAKPVVYKLWSLMCRFGIREASLRLRHDRCGAPGTSRPIDPNGRQKAGRKTVKQRLAKAAGISLPPDQPGMSTDWTQRIMAADRKIPSPKPDHPERYIQIIDSSFVSKFKYEDGKMVATQLVKGTYPNRSQVRRVLEREIPWLERLREKTTKGHFLRSMRAMTARNWKGVAGPGHTWAIDSTIGDIYLRSSLNRAWIIGRPIVYVIVDVWSTAVVGFYVCLSGPSWDTAKISLFSSAVNPELVADLWQYQPMMSLAPYPTLPAVLMCDRGEYLSKAASVTSMKLIPCMSYAPAYRPDLKGLVEVLHRIEKDRQYWLIPGAIDARRKEFELRRFDPNESVMTVQEYVHYLYTTFTVYNLTAPRDHRIDTFMSAAGVMASPAGLWRYGHEIGIGTRRAHSETELITTLLPQQSATVSRTGVNFAGLNYESDVVNQEQWTAFARNHGSWKIPAHHFPGSVSRIWTPNSIGTNLLDLRLSQQARASKEQTLDEVLDTFMYGKSNRADIEHANTIIAQQAQAKVNSLIASATEKTAADIERQRGQKPTLLESRTMEQEFSGHSWTQPEPQGTPRNDETEDAYADMISTMINAANSDTE